MNNQQRRSILATIAGVCTLAGCVGTQSAVQSHSQRTEDDRSRSSDEQLNDAPSQSITTVIDESLKEATVNIVAEDEMRFDPQLVWIKSGGSVTWTNWDDHDRHDIVSFPDRIPDGATKFQSDRLTYRERFTHTFEQEGIYDYVCTPHASWMVGRVIVGTPEIGKEPAMTADNTALESGAAAIFTELNTRTQTIGTEPDCGCPE